MVRSGTPSSTSPRRYKPPIRGLSGLKLFALRNILERRFGLTELEAGTAASYLLSGSIILYPICGIVVDRVKRGGIVLQLMTTSSILTLLCYFWMTVPPAQTHTPWPAIACFGTAFGFAPRRLPWFFSLSRILTIP